MRKTLIHHLSGSKLYGTDIAGSDTDYKMVYLPSLDDLLLGNTISAQQSTTGDDKGRNTDKDTDLTKTSVQKFVNLLAKGDMGAIETLFSINNPDVIIEKHNIFDKIYDKRSLLISKNVHRALGYMRSQTNRYVVRGSRAKAVNEIVNILESFDQGARVESLCLEINAFCCDNEFSEVIVLEDGNTYLSVCDRKVPIRAKIGDAYKVYKKLQDEYGKRTAKAVELGGFDAKGVAHAVRIGQQMIELLETGEIKFPRPNANYLKSIRLGIADMDKVYSNLESIFDHISAIGEKNKHYKTDQHVIDQITKEIHREIL